jgi:hypothetical protein
MIENNIYNNIISPLTECAASGHSLSVGDLCRLRDNLSKCTDENEQKFILQQLSPLYEAYIKGKKPFVGYFENEIIRKFCDWDVAFGTKIANLDLIETAISWADNNSEVRVEDFISLLTCYSKACPNEQWDDLEQEVWHEILKLEVYGNRTKAGYLVLLHGFLRIVIRRPDPLEQQKFIDLFIENWDYLKLVYSVMIRCIVDCGHKDFAGVANNVRILSRCHPYIYIFYSVLSERFEDLCQSGTDREKLSKHLNKIMEIMNTTTQDCSHLDILCRIFFPDSFKEYLDKNRLPSYDEVVNELNEMKNKVDSLNSQIEQMAQRMVNAVNASIPVGDIEKELLRLSPGTSYDVFTQVNSLLTGNKAWMERASDIKQKILSMRDNPTIVNGNVYQSGATHDDRSKHIELGDNSNQLKLEDK